MPAPAVVLHSAYADQALTIPALVAGVDARLALGATELTERVHRILERLAHGARGAPCAIRRGVGMGDHPHASWPKGLRADIATLRPGAALDGPAGVRLTARGGLGSNVSE